MAAAIVLVLAGGPASALDLEVQPLARGYRTGFWAPIRVAVSTGKEPFQGNVVLGLGAAQVHRVPLSIPAHARREVTVGVLPYRPAEQLVVEAGDRRVVLDLRAAAGPLLAAEAALAETARRERDVDIAVVGEEDSALWEAFDQVLVTQTTALRRWGLRVDTPHAWVRPRFRPWGLEWSVSEGVRHGVPSIQALWAGRLAPAPWGPEAKRRFLLSILVIATTLAVALATTVGRGPRLRALAVGACGAVLTTLAALGPAPRPAVSAFTIVGPSGDGAWRARGLACASRGSSGDIDIPLPGVPRPVFRTLADAQEASWGVVWGERARLVFPSRAAGQGCWFEWRTEAPISGRVVSLRNGGAANELRQSMSLALLIVDGQAVAARSLAEGESLSPGTAGPLPWPFTTSLLGSLDPAWRKGRHLLGRVEIDPPGLADVDVVESQTWAWAPLD